MEADALKDTQEPDMSSAESHHIAGVGLSGDENQVGVEHVESGNSGGSGTKTTEGSAAVVSTLQSNEVEVIEVLSDGNGSNDSVSKASETQNLAEKQNSCSDEQGKNDPDIEHLPKDTSDANNTSDETFCSNVSSSMIVEGTKDLMVIAESDNEDQEKEPPGDTGSLESKSQDDMFASQHPDDDDDDDAAAATTTTTKQCSQESTGPMDYSDFIPSSQSTESYSIPPPGVSKGGSYEADRKDKASSPTPRKRKLEVASELDSKIPRIEAEDTSVVLPTILGGVKTCEQPEESMKSNKLSTSSLLTKVPTKVTISEMEVEISPKKDATTKEITPSASTKRSITFDEQSASDVQKSENVTQPKKGLVCDTVALGTDKKVQPILAEVASVGKTDLEQPLGRSCRSSLQIVYMSPTVKASQDPSSTGKRESREESQQIQTKSNEDMLPTVEVHECHSQDDEEEDFQFLYLSVPSTLSRTQEEINASKECGTQPSSSSKNTSSERSGSEKSWNSHNQLCSNSVHGETTNITSNSHVEGKKSQKCAEVLTIEEDDDELEVLSSQGKTKSTLQSKSDTSNTKSNGNSSLFPVTTSTSNDVTVIDDGNSSSGDKLKGSKFSLGKQTMFTSNGSTSNSDTASEFARGKESAKMKSSASSLFQSSLGIKSTFIKRKREAAKNKDVIHVPGSDSEGEDKSEPNVTKKSREEDNTPDVISKQLVKEKYVSTPNDGYIQTSVNESISSIEMDTLKEHTPQTMDNETTVQKDNSPDINRGARELKKVYLSCLVEVEHSEPTREILSWEVTQWDDITDECASSFTQISTDLSPGTLADVSKTTSPASTTSLGPFPFQSRQLQRISVSSSSSGGTSVSGFSVFKSKSLMDNGLFAAPLRPAARTLKGSSFSSENMLGKFSITHPGRHIILKESELAEKIERRIQLDSNCEGEAGERTGNEVLSVNPKSKSGQVESEIRSGVWKSKSAPTLPLELKNDTQTRRGSKSNKEEISMPESKSEKMAIETTPKSSKKSHARPARTARKATRGGAMKAVKEGKDDADDKQAAGDQVTKSGGSSSVQKRSRRAPLRTPASNKKSDTAVEEAKSVSTQSSRPRRGRSDRNETTGNLGTPEVGEITSNWSVESCITKLVPDAPAFARWTDKKYYSARIKEKVKDDRWTIEFDDGNVKVLKEEFIIPVNILTKGQIVFASVEDECNEGIITKFKVEDDEVHYGIEVDGGEIVYLPRSKLFMTEDQARILQEDVVSNPTVTTPKSTSVSIDNIVQGKRSRSNRALFRTMESPGVSGVAKLPSKRLSKTDSAHDASCSSSVSDATDKGSTSALEEVGGVDPEVHTTPEPVFALKIRGKGPGKIKGKGKSTPRRGGSSNHSITEAENPELGPIPPKGSKMFSGMHFLMTFAGVRTPSQSRSQIQVSQKARRSSSSDDGETEDDNYAKIFSKYLFVQEYLKRQLEAGGGEVYEHFQDVPEHLYTSCYLIADRPTQTAKYILCLASGIKIILHDWIISKTKGLDNGIINYELQAGWSLEDQCYFDDDSRSKKRKPLNKKEVGLVNDSKCFITFWERVLKALGAKVRNISSEEDKEFSTVDVIVSDSSCPPEIQDRAREWSIPLVSTVWVKQCLITWKARQYDGHPYYRYDYCPSD